MVFIHIEGRLEKLEHFCSASGGNVLPTPVMSNGMRMQLEFRSVAESVGVTNSGDRRRAKGFQAKFTFVESKQYNYFDKTFTEIPFKKMTNDCIFISCY